MCEFCAKHGEGKQWYRLMKNYSQEMFHTPLTDEQKRVVGFNTRGEWMDDFIRSFLLPAAGIKSQPSSLPKDDKTEKPSRPRSKAQRLAWRKIEHFGQVLPIEDVENVLGMAEAIIRIPCGCRYESRGMTNARYCFNLGIDPAHMLHEYADLAASFEVIAKDEAVRLIRKFDEEGLMHSVWSGITPYVGAICNCDGDCQAYQGYIKDRGIPSFFRAEYICQVDPDQCNGCRECMRQCQFGAQFYSAVMGKVSIEPKLCFGCGVCRSACPQGAIELISREKSPEAVNIW